MSVSPIFGYSNFMTANRGSDESGWDRTRWSMLKSRVEAFYPDAVGDKWGNLKIAGAGATQNYDINFKFDQDQRLSSVVLSFHGVPSDVDFKEINRLLVNRLGEPAIAGAWNYTWSAGRTDIALSRGQHLEITYSKASI